VTGLRRAWDDPQAMVSVDDALKQILDSFSPLPSIRVPLLDSLGLVMAEDVIARDDIPPFRNSAMDGYAVRAADTSPSPVVLDVIGTVAAGGYPDKAVEAGQAMRIMTGAPLPDGADTVVRFEETDELRRSTGSGQIEVSRIMAPWENVREPGEDVAAGSVALRAGLRVRPSEIGLLASLNESTVLVHRRPRIGIISTGDELVDIGLPLFPGAIRNSNSYIVAAAVKRYGGVPVMLGIARDSSSDLAAKLDTSGQIDMFVTSGGVSVGDYDMVKDVLRAKGRVDIWQVRMKPGKPLAFGHVGKVPLLGLPGNPVAALISMEQFGRASILKMLGRSDLKIPETWARVTSRVENRGGRRHYVRGILTRTQQGNEFTSCAVQGSAILTSVVESNCYLVVPETSAVVEAGEVLSVQLPDEGL
jgi:molybdopterin molybdotransferase